jgi:hypothetical protein
MFRISFRDPLSTFNKLCTSKRLWLSTENSFQLTVYVIRSTKLSTRDFETSLMSYDHRVQRSLKSVIINPGYGLRLQIQEAGQIQSEPKKYIIYSPCKTKSSMQVCFSWTWGSQSGGYEEFFLLGYAFRRKSADVSEEHVGSTFRAVYLLHAGLLLYLFFDPEYLGEMFLRNVGWLSTDYMDI